MSEKKKIDGREYIFDDVPLPTSPIKGGMLPRMLADPLPMEKPKKKRKGSYRMFSEVWRKAAIRNYAIFRLHGVAATVSSIMMSNTFKETNGELYNLENHIRKVIELVYKDETYKGKGGK